MSERVPIGGIGRGLNDSIAPSEAPASTYREGHNVRGIDPRTGRVVWGAQRAGLTKFGDDFAAGYPTCFATAFRLVQAREWQELTNVLEPSTDPQAVEEAWTLDLPGPAVDVATGPDGQAYYLLLSGDVAVVNSKGREVELIRSASRAFYDMVPRVEVAEDGSVFVAQTNSLDDELPRGYLTRWVRQEDKTWTSTWETEFEDPITAFGYRSGALYVALLPEQEENEPLPSAKLARISQPLLGPEVAWNRPGLPRPILDVTVNDRGQALISCPSNEERQSVNDGFGERRVSWTPSQEADWELDGWAWFDAYHVNESSDGLSQGDVVEKMRDRRHEETIFAQPDETSPVRDLVSPQSGVFQPPTYDPDAFGGAGGVKFVSRTALVSGYNTDTTDQALNLAMIPSQELRGGGINSYLVAMIIQFSEDQMSSAAQKRIFGQENDTSGSEPSWTFQTSAADAGRVVLADETASVSVDAGAAGVFDPTTRTAVVSWYHDDQVAAQDIELFIDGTSRDLTAGFSDPIQAGPWEHATGSTQTLPGPFTVLGGGLPNPVNLLRDTGVALTSSVQVQGSLEVLRDGLRQDTAIGNVVQFRPSGVQETYIDIDFGVGGVQFDTISWWVTDRGGDSGGGGTVNVYYSNSPIVSGAPQATLTVSTTSSGVSAVQDSYALETGGSQFRYVRFERTEAGGGGLELTELEVHYENVSAFDDAAEFTVGEIVTTSVVDANATTIRQKLEGYLAHRWGVSLQLDGAHPHRLDPPVGAGSTTRQDSGQVAQALRSPDPILAKFATDGEAVAAYTGAGVGLGAAVNGDSIYTVGEVMADPTPDFGTMLTKFTDEGYSFTRDVGFAGGGENPAIKTTRPVLGPRDSMYIAFQPAVTGSTGVESVRRYSADLAASPANPLWTLAIEDASSNPVRPNGIAAGGFAVDETERGGSSGQEFLYLAADGDGEQARRVTALGLRDTGQKPGRVAEQLVVLSTGDVVRARSDETWETLEAGALPGPRPGSATLYGNTFFADGLGYRVYNHATGQLRDFEEAVKGEFPSRCSLIAAYNGRLVVARGDSAFTVYQSRYGDPFDFDYGPEIQSISQAIAGTTASQGSVPEPITALMPWRDAQLFIGTTESLFVQTGDLADGGRLDQVDKSQGVALGYAWCESPGGIYYFSARGGVMFVSPRGELRSVSSGAIQRRLEEIDLTSNRIDMAYNWIDKTVHVFVIPDNIGGDVEHYAYEEPMAAWHKDTFGGGYERAVTTVGVQLGDTPEDRAVYLGFAGGRVRRWDQYAEDDAGEPVYSSAIVGPLTSDMEDAETRVTGLYGLLASDQGPVEVGVRGSESADAPGPPGPFSTMAAGRGLGVPVNVAAPSVFIEVRGLGTSWAIHNMKGEVALLGQMRSRS